VERQPSPVEKPKRRWPRYLRIGVSGLFGVVCVLLVVLWVRSYWRVDKLRRPNGNNSCEVSVFNGQILARWHLIMASKELHWILSAPIENAPSVWGRPVLGFRFRSSSFTVPIWFLAALSGVLSAIPWAHFSLRTLLIATTLVAILLGLIVYAAG
jgi:hypothetical protein